MLIAVLDAYGHDGGKEPLLVLGDNRTVIATLYGEGRLRHPPLQTLAEQATALARRIPHGVRYHWLPRDDHRVADRLASHSRARSWGAEACLWWISARICAMTTEGPAKTICRHCS